jgi:hypothetical protein
LWGEAQVILVTPLTAVASAAYCAQARQSDCIRWHCFRADCHQLCVRFVGVLVAVPVSAAIGVLVRFGLKLYLKSEIHQGLGAGGKATAQTVPDIDLVDRQRISL